MQLMEDRIRAQGKALNSDVLLVDSFLNHQVDMQFMQAVGAEFASAFRDQAIDRVATIESSGIAPAAMTALALNVPLVVMKKSTSNILTEEIFQTPVFSFTKGSRYLLTVKRHFLPKGDRVLLIDDFLANGEAALGAVRLIELCGAKAAGIGILIEKAFQPGRKRLEEAGLTPYSLARIGEMDAGHIQFIH